MAINVSPEQQGADSVQKCRIIVVIDPGHGDHNDKTSGVDPGALGGPNMEFKEKDIVLDVAKVFKQKLEAKTDVIEAVYLTREGDVGSGELKKLQWRLDFANEKKAPILVSLHMNSACKCPRNAKGQCIVPKGGHIVDTTANGKEVWCYPGKAQSKSLATSIMAAFTLPLKRRGQTGVFEREFRVIKIEGTIKASALIEMGFIPNENDRTQVINNKSALADQFTEGVVNYIIANRAALCGDDAGTVKLPDNPPLPRPRPKDL
ncbi:N-acetylmuramoyl-L-alanine amidase family protein [Polyangium sorediatum]|uniref:N-acetylmuramoyl-L-alanine amidase n=1 Tax=Polyangium sorediatum TaxID=889274 RepID=A0ABT6P2V0_9BACT|nr:N-acetylmuramoyl-L-alanine amidase [Polyangium sorediatum]MDI1434888.1 N-acetylmuramoyl-L-alanine amidase [Polyangium sorediatum]